MRGGQSTFGAAGGHGAVSFGAEQAPAWCPRLSPCSKQLWMYTKDRQTLTPNRQGWGSDIDGNENIIFLKTFPGLASAPIHQ